MTAPILPQQASHTDNMPFLKEKVQYAAEERFFFTHAIIGFGEHQEYLLTPFPRPEYKPFDVLISANNPMIYFIVIQDIYIDPQDAPLPNISELCKEYGYCEKSVKCYYIATVHNQKEHLSFSINARAPLLMYHEKKCAGQYIIINQDIPFVSVLEKLSMHIREHLK